MFVLTIFVTGVGEIVDQWAFYDSETNTKRNTFILRTPYFFSYLISVVLAAFSSHIYYGPSGLKSAFNVKQVAIGLPVALAYTFADWCGVKAKLQLDASLWKVMGQSKLIITAVLAWLILRQRQTSTQWMVLMASSFSIAAYTMIGLGDIVITDFSILGLAWVSIFVGCGASIVSEWLLKSVKNPFVVQMCQSRVGSLICTAFFLVIEVTKNEDWHRFPFGGWSYKTWLMLLCDLAKSWLTSIIVKSMSSVWRALAIAASLGVTYLGSVVFLQPLGLFGPFNSAKFILIMTISTNVMTYAGAKRDQHKALQLKLDADRRLKGDA